MNGWTLQPTDVEWPDRRVMLEVGAQSVSRPKRRVGVSFFIDPDDGQEPSLLAMAGTETILNADPDINPADIEITVRSIEGRQTAFRWVQ